MSLTLWPVSPPEAFPYPDLWINLAALSEQEEDNIADKDREDMVV